MPCYTIRTTTVDLSAMGRIDLQLLTDALNALGLGAALQTDGKTIIGNQVSFANGKLTWYGKARATADQVQQQYAAAVVRSQAKRFGWQLTEVKNTQTKEVRR